MPTPTIPAGNLYMNATTYTGNGSTQTITNGVAGQSFQPDFVWGKVRSTVENHCLYDSLRGAGYILKSNTTDAELNNVGFNLTSFNSNGFSLGVGNQINQSGQTNVAWQWKAGGTAVTNTSGTITSQVSANTTSGFSIVTYTGTSGAGTVGHGLGVAPAFIIAKSRNNAVNWITYHQSTGKDAYMNLNTTNASASLSNYWGTSVNSTTFGFLSNAYDNANGNMVAYCWSEIAGFSKFGSYTGNGSTDGPFVYLGFRPKFILFKVTSTAGSWVIHDSSRDPYNASQSDLYPNLSNAEATSNAMDLLSNGFKLRNTDNTNAAQTYIYAAFAENPFKYANAR